MFFKTKQFLAATIFIICLMSGCGFDNGLPNNLTTHLAIYGIQVQVSHAHAPISSRAGFVTFAIDPAIEAKIIKTFKLVKIDPGDPRFRIYTDQIAEKQVSLWGISGRPAILKLTDGGQFEYIYLLTTKTRCYLFAEYAYG